MGLRPLLRFQEHMMTELENNFNKLPKHHQESIISIIKILNSNPTTSIQNVLSIAKTFGGMFSVSNNLKRYAIRINK